MPSGQPGERRIERAAIRRHIPVNDIDLRALAMRLLIF
jgi:hypothetical protein